MDNPATNNTTKKWSWKGNHTVVVVCANCGKEKVKYISRATRNGNNYCCDRCYREAKARGISNPYQGKEKNPNWKGGLSAVPFVCKKCGKPFIARAANKRQYCSPECWYQTVEKPENGRTLRKRPGYWSWRSHTMKKSNHLCAMCGCHANHAHHLLMIKDYPELRANGQNGMAFCEKHHTGIHRGNFGGGVSPQNSWLCQVVFWNEFLLGT